MGLLQKACETYDCFSSLVGKYEYGKTPLAPISHAIKSALIEITLDQDGNFILARDVDKDDAGIIIPVTEESAGRTSAACAHPLCDYISYIAPYDEKKNKLYVDQLTDWAQSQYTHPKLTAILNYVRRGTILSDLKALKNAELDENGHPKNEKALIRWVVNGLGLEQSGPCWDDKSLFQSFVDYYAFKKNKDDAQLCMISGELEAAAQQHPKGIIPINGNAKLISANDSSNFTYRGRFAESWQAATVSYTVSQKAHNALSWIAANQGVRAAMPGDEAIEVKDAEREFTVYGGRTFLCWNPQGVAIPGITGAFAKKAGAAKRKPSEYRESLDKVLSGYKAKLPEAAGVVIAAFDAATTGRLSVTYYNELLASDFLDRLCRWDKTCCWKNENFGIQSPLLYNIANYAFGNYRENRFVTDDKILRQQMQRLISCRVDMRRFPHDIEQRLVEAVSNMNLYDDSTREKLLFTACAVIQKYYFDRNEERWNMSTDLNIKDRSFQFGRLLALMERTEQYYYWKTGESKETTEDDSEKAKRTDRQTNAIRMLSVYCKRPFSTSIVIDKKLRIAYLPRIKTWQQESYLKTAGEIAQIIYEFDDSERNKPLTDKYILGYYLQRNEMNSKKKTENTTDNMEEKK